MSDASVSVLPSSRWQIPHAAFAVCTVILALVMIRPPVAIDVDPGITYRALLYESVRAGHAWGTQFITTDGPLGALQAPGYLKGSVWMAMVWQIAGNLLLAAVLVGAVFQLPRSLKWWVVALLAGMLARVPMLAPWLVMVLLGHELVRARTTSLPGLVLSATTLGFLALSSISHLLLGLTAILLVLLTRRPSVSKGAVCISFVITFLIGWTILGQPFSALTQWISRTLPALTQSSELLRSNDTDSVAPWAALATLVLIVGLALRLRNTGERRDFLATGLFLLGATWLAWKTISLQPDGSTEFFFGTALLIGFIFLYRNLSRKWTVTLILVSIVGLIRGNSLLITDGVGQINRQLVASVRLLFALPQLRTNLLLEVKAHSAAQAMPRIKAAIGDATVDVLGDSPSRAILNGLNVRLRPAPLSAMLRSRGLAKLNAMAYMGPNAPAFVIQGFRPQGDLATGFSDAPTQLALYQHYDLQFEETGLMLWRKKVSNPETPELVASGVLTFGERLHLPSTGTAYWLELEIPPSVLGQAWGMIDEIPEPGLVIRDASGTEQRYSLPTTLSGAGFLIEPFVRGEVDFIRRESGAKEERLSEIAVFPPVRGGWWWTGRCHYRLFNIPGVTLTSTTLSNEPLQTYRLLSRPPVALLSNSRFNIVPTEQNDFVLFAHPPSMLEFAVTPSDRRVRCRIGMLPGASQGSHPTDGVDFSIEFLGSDGIRQGLYHRWLDPVGNRGDQGLQDVTVNLPRSSGGRLFLRTYNPPGRNASYDWAFWSYVVIE